MADTRFLGQVKFFNRDKGFGFITRLDDNRDFFVHHRDITPKSQCWNIIYQGEYVEFEIRQGPNGEQAGTVTGPRGGSLLCEHNFGGGNKKKRRQGPNEEVTPQPMEM